MTDNELTTSTLIDTLEDLLSRLAVCEENKQFRDGFECCLDVVKEELNK